jgi:hypothetical protein
MHLRQELLMNTHIALFSVNEIEESVSAEVRQSDVVDSRTLIFIVNWRVALRQAWQLQFGGLHRWSVIVD